MVYMYQLNPFNFEWKENPFENAHYNLEGGELVEFSRVDLETYKVR